MAAKGEWFSPDDFGWMDGCRTSLALYIGGGREGGRGYFVGSSSSHPADPTPNDDGDVDKQQRDRRSRFVARLLGFFCLSYPRLIEKL